MALLSSCPNPCATCSTFCQSASSNMRIPTLNDEETHHPGRTGGGILAVVAVSVIVLAALFFWPESTATRVTDPEVIKSLQYIGESEQRTMSGIKAINESL